jgi:hypothetical protein
MGLTEPANQFQFRGKSVVNKVQKSVGIFIAEPGDIAAAGQYRQQENQGKPAHIWFSPRFREYAQSARMHFSDPDVTKASQWGAGGGHGSPGVG